MKMCERRLGARPPGDLEILHALKCVLGAPEALFRACTQHIYICNLPSSISGFSLKSTTYGALASRLCSRECINLRFMSATKQKKQAYFSQKYS